MAVFSNKRIIQKKKKKHIKVLNKYKIELVDKKKKHTKLLPKKKF